MPPPGVIRRISALCCNAMRVISFSGTAIFTFNLPTPTIFPTDTPGSTFWPTSMDLSAITPPNGAYRLQSFRFFRASSSIERACRSLLCTSTHLISAKLPLSCSSFMRAYASSACANVAWAASRLLCMEVGSSVASSCPLPTRSPTLKCTSLTVPMTGKLSGVPAVSSIVPE